MASRSSAQANSGTKEFDFSTDDIFYSYEGYENQESTNGSNSNPAGGTNSTKDSIHQDLTAIVDRSMKKHCENIVRFLEGLGSRLSQLELYCYNVEKSVGEMRHEMTGDHSDTEIKFEALDEHIHEVHRSVQILRDKQELADTQKELEKLQLAQKETSSHGSQASEDKSSASASDSRKTEIQPNGLNQQLALILPHQQQLAQQQQSFPLPPQNVPQMQNYYLQHTQIPNQSTATQIHYVACDPEGRTSQMQDMPRVGQSQMNQTQNMSPYPQYQQQWSQQLPHPMQPPLQQQSSLPPQTRAPSPPVYSPYSSSGQATNPPPQSQETLYSSSMQMPMQYSGVLVPVTSRVDSVPYGYSAQGRIVQQQQHIKCAFGQQTDHGYASSTLPPSTGYLIYDSSPQQGHFSQKITQPAT